MRRLAISLMLLGVILLVAAIGCEKGGGAKPNQPPTKPTITASATTIKSGGTVNLTASSTDPDGDTLTYTWSADGGSFSSTTGDTTTWTAPSVLGDQSYTISVEVSDGKGGKNNNSVAISVMSSKIAFDSNRDGNPEIYIMGATGANQTRLTNHTASDIDPAISPDGSKIAFMSDRDGNAEIYVMNVDGTSVTNLTNNPAGDAYPDWSPDGTKIVFTSTRDDNVGIYVMNADGSNQTRLTNDPYDDILPSWSPDGKEIAFSRDYSGSISLNSHYAERVRNSDGADIFKMKSDGTDLVNLTNTPTINDEAPAWSPDGSKIAFQSDRDGDYEVYYLNVSNPTLQVNLTKSSSSDEGVPAWSPDGSKIAFVSDRDGNDEIYSMKSSDGSDQTRLTNNSADDEAPDWSPR
jgi:Tol biopolymer transport system component